MFPSIWFTDSLALALKCFLSSNIAPPASPPITEPPAIVSISGSSNSNTFASGCFLLYILKIAQSFGLECIIFLGLRENPCFLEIKASAEPTPAAVVRKTPAVEQFWDLSGGCFEA